MEHPAQNTMLFPASYAVLSDEEMTYLEGGAEIPLFEAFGYQVTIDSDVLGVFCQTVALNLFALAAANSFQYIAGRAQSGYQNGLSLSGTFYHAWDKMPPWSRVAAVGVAGLACYYVASQAVNIYRSLKNLYDQIVNPMPVFAAAPTTQTAAA